MPITPIWSLKIGIVMIACNLVAILLGRYSIQKSGLGPHFPLELPAELDGFGIPELLATTSLGHILGVGTILGLSALGVFNLPS
uniref:Photosystem I reaction center subunit PsaK n=1 Tax=Glaucocystis incrassata TaxID=1789788 RepID=A0A3G1IV99_9EUKA|nr:photosystem I reaction center subunit K [Glaucocystis incrassata]ASQ39968.1 photosystem I reaction center subunit K [Glaucocystis incrassata]